MVTWRRLNFGKISEVRKKVSLDKKVREIGMKFRKLFFSNKENKDLSPQSSAENGGTTIRTRKLSRGNG